MARSVEFFTILIIAQLFFSIGINVLTYIAPTEANVYMSNIFGINVFDVKDVQDQLESSLSQQTNTPLIDLGALAFYSGNIILDLILNFAFAVPQMATIIFQSLALIFNMDPTVLNLLQTYIFVIFFSLYILGLVRFLSSLRVGRIDV